MDAPTRLKVFTDKYPAIGPTFWMVSIQYFITMAVVGALWAVHYSLSQNTISDLGNSACGIYDARYVCSPGYTWMNTSFIVLGATMVAGSALIYQEFRKNVGTLIGFSFMAIAGLGTILVGLFPENTIGELHFFGALLAFLIGNLGLVILGFSLGVSKPFRFYTIISGAVSLVALALFASHNYFGLGAGTMERLSGHPQTIWLIVFGIYMSRDRFRNAALKSFKKFRLS
jgi:hypothetical membrane protein